MLLIMVLVKLETDDSREEEGWDEMGSEEVWLKWAWADGENQYKHIHNSILV